MQHCCVLGSVGYPPVGGMDVPGHLLVVLWQAVVGEVLVQAICHLPSSPSLSSSSPLQLLASDVRQGRLELAEMRASVAKAQSTLQRLATKSSDYRQKAKQVRCCVCAEY